MWQDIFFAIWFLLPAALANSAPLVAAKIPWLKDWQTPIDFDKKWRGHAIFGPHKTWRGLISGIVVATLVFWLQKIVTTHYEWLRFTTEFVDYQNLSIILMGILFGVGALGGDAIKSFFKRRVNVKPGSPWPPFDQIDFILGSIVLTSPVTNLSLSHILLIIVLWIPLHYAGNLLGWILRLKKRPI